MARRLPLRANEGGKAADDALQEGWNRVREIDTSLAVEILQGAFCVQEMKIFQADRFPLGKPAFPEIFVPLKAARR